MATADNIFALAKAATTGDRAQVLSMCRIIAASERQGSSLGVRLHRLVERSGAAGIMPSEVVPNELRNLVLHVVEILPIEDVILPAPVAAEVNQFLQERIHLSAIQESGLRPPNRILLSGPPGNGKTTLAGAIAGELDLPFLVLDYSTVVSSYMGETGAKLAKVFRGLGQRPVVLFVDEMETVLTERSAPAGSRTDVGEMARVVSTLLQEIDRLPDHVVLIGATNHAEMLDRAVVRRFDYRWELPAPDTRAVQRWIERFASRYPTLPIHDQAALVLVADSKSLSDLERDVTTLCRRWVVARERLQSGQAEGVR